MRNTPDQGYGFRSRNKWGEGTELAQYTVGDVVYVPPGSAAVLSGRCEAGLHRVLSCFSIGEDASWYYRLSPCDIAGEKGQLRIQTDWEIVSDRLHVIPGKCDYTAGWIRLYNHPERDV